MTHEEIWNLLGACSGENTEVILDAFYPEFYEAITPHTGAFALMSEIKANLKKLKFSDHEITQQLCNHPVYGMRINIGCSPLFDYERFLSFFK